LEFCRKQGVTRLELNSFASAAASIPVWPGERSRRKRCEYVLDLGPSGTDLWKRLASNHARNIKRARKLGLEVRRTRESAACRIHADLMAASLERRKDRGESVFEDDALQPVLALTRHGAGELFQIVRQQQVLSSILVLLADKGAYYHSAGTSPDGMACGASHCLIHDIAQTLQGQGLERFNLGGADETNAGLERFKSGFGATATELEAAEFSFAGPLRRAVSSVATLLAVMRSGRSSGV
jgi:lipid II:glycine glycyltransferase (peptidoglycan interpeptide bridge formation enzyme)